MGGWNPIRVAKHGKKLTTNPAKSSTSDISLNRTARRIFTLLVHIIMSTAMPSGHFIHFKAPIADIALPERFTFPFHYQPHPLSRLAAHELQNHLEHQQAWQHDFGFWDSPDGLGKMFGVLVVQNTQGELGYLAAFSGKLAGTNHLAHFVPPVFDMLRDDGFYRLEEEEISQINRRIAQLESDPKYLASIIGLEAETTALHTALADLKQAHRAAKASRDLQRKEAPAEATALLEALNRESAQHHFQWKDAARHWSQRLAAAQQSMDVFLQEINRLKEKRRQKSAQLQEKLFHQYTFLNPAKQAKSLLEIFQIDENTLPPSGAGECAAPKLLQYAFLHDLKPIVMAEFWWGKTPSSEIRRHGQFYPACRGKCEPILAHMLAGIPMDKNPLEQAPSQSIDLPIVYEDEHLLVLNKPAGFLSVPGKKMEDSVYTRIKKQYPNADGPLIVHRLDMATSGLLLIAKTKAVHQDLQAQFASREVKKRYVALLDGTVATDEGIIDLPLRVDLDDRPRQLVCYDHGKLAQTRWQVIERTEGQTRIHFFPLTGRTHQLRVHAAHVSGLHCPIVGDDLYGKPAERLHLHAASLAFMHPVSREVVSLEVECLF